MVVLPLVLILFLVSGVKCQVEFIARRPNSTVSVPDSLIFLKNIDQLSPDFREQESQQKHEVATVEDTQDRQQFHSLVKDGTGSYYLTSSRVAHACSLHEQKNFFYEPIPLEYEAGQNALIPCLINGIPTPDKRVERCNSSSCEETFETEFRNHLVTADGHVVAVGANVNDSGWYRCAASNVCGNLTSTPIFIDIRDEKRNRSQNQPFYVLSRATDSRTFDFIVSQDEHLGLMKELTRRKVTEYQLWKLNTTKPSFHDEVFYLQTSSIYFYYYPPSIDPAFLEGKNYGGIVHNNSCSTHYTSFDTLPSFTVEFTTELQSPPNITPKTNMLHNSPSEEMIIGFTVNNSISSEVQCYRNSVRLLNNWKTKIEMTKGTIEITLRYPLLADGGYYQCSITYDVVYISAPQYVHIKKPVKSYRFSTTITETSATLTWDLLSLPRLYHEYQGQFVVLLSGHAPLLTPNKSVRFDDLIPNRNYTWRIMTPDQNPVTELHSFRTSSEKLNWLHVILPILCLLVTVGLLATLVKIRCPDALKKLNQALEPNYLTLLHDQEEWDNSNEVAIVHTEINNCNV